ncbi:MAG: molybdopterin-binding/glycosyltransferase family 2 protein [Acidisphaera sp.]|nr:molybdopterin-binding/glycosyltransferase family 2 protein [Acidisphaera sp.]
MIFGTVALQQAEGAILAHTQRLPGRVLKKGSVLDASALAALREAGHPEVIAARLEPGDIGENACAERMGAALAAPGLRPSAAGTGRVNLLAETAGLLRVDTALIDRLNTLDDALTVATVPDYTPLAARDMVATMKVIPFAAPAAALERLEALARDGGPAFALNPFRPLKAGLVLTELPGLKESVTENTIAATQARVAALTGSLLPPLRCPHAEAPIAEALKTLLSAGAELLMVAGASAVVDRRDVGPAAIVRAGGEIRHFGMPVDPGNLICIGRIGAVPALVLPGCARSPRANGIDWVLQRIYAGLDVGPAEVMRMGVGGLLKDIEARPMPRAKAVPVSPEAPQPRTVAAIVLAAGRSSRMAPHNKLLLPDRTGKPMIARVVDNVLSSAARPVIVVIGHRADAVRDALGGRPVQYVEAADHADGLSASLKAGIAAVPPAASAAIICLGDMPLVTGRMIDRVIAAYDRDEGRLIVVPAHHGKPGNPILWDRRFFGEMRGLSGDAGARFLLGRHLEHVAEIEIEQDAVLRDFDTVESLADLPARLRPVEMPG